MSKFILSKVEGTKIHSKKLFFLPLLLAFFGLGVFVFSSDVWAATRLVDDAGVDSGNCVASACRTIIYAHSQATSGDTISVAPGTYNESITISKPNITLQGTLDANGNRLSIIDPYTKVNGSWTLTGDTNRNGACDDGETACKGVYTQNIGIYKPWGMLVEIGGVRYKIVKLCQSEESSSSDCSNPDYYLTRPTTLTYISTLHSWPPPPESIRLINFWDGFNALFTCYASGLCKVRFDDSSNPNAKDIYIATDGDNTITVSANGVTIKDMEIRAKKYGIYSASSSNTTVHNNLIRYGREKVYITGDNTTVSNNVIKDQRLQGDNIGDTGQYTRGSWGTNDATFLAEKNYYVAVRRHLYGTTKYGVSDSDAGITSRAIRLNGDSVSVHDNTITDVNEGIELWESSNFEVYNNNITGTESGGIGYLCTGNGGLNSSIHDNTLSDINSTIRFQYWNGSLGAGGNNKTNIKIYNNKIWHPTNIGTHLTFHFSNGGGDITDLGEIWAYHNSFSGGYRVVEGTSYAGYFSPERGLENTYFINNIMSTRDVWSTWNSICNCTPAPGGFWYNWQVGTGQRSGTGNYRGGETLLWDTIAPHNFAIPLPAGAAAINSGIDISKSFAINGITYPALPGFTAGYGGSDGKPDMGAVQSNNSDITPPEPPSGVIVQ